jgi:hypothetical protein
MPPVKFNLKDSKYKNPLQHPDENSPYQKTLQKGIVDINSFHIAGELQYRNLERDSFFA